MGNLLLLSGTLLVVITQLDELPRSILAVLVVIVWILLPLLEIDHYGEILRAEDDDDSQTPWSLYWNGLTGVFAAVFIGFVNQDGEPVRTFDLFNQQWTFEVIVGILVAILFPVVA
jgi:hypothetical protein